MKKIALVLAVATGLAFSGNSFAAVVKTYAVPAQKIVVVQQPVRTVVVQQPVKVVKQYPQYQYQHARVYHPAPKVVYVQPAQPRTVNTAAAVITTVIGVGMLVAALAN